MQSNDLEANTMSDVVKTTAQTSSSGQWTQGRPASNGSVSCAGCCTSIHTKQIYTTAGQLQAYPEAVPHGTVQNASWAVVPYNWYVHKLWIHNISSKHIADTTLPA